MNDAEEDRWMRLLEQVVTRRGYIASATDDDDEEEVDQEWWDEEDEDDDWDENWAEEPESHEAMAVRLMEALVENNLDSYILLKDDHIATWWGDILKYRKKKEEKRLAAEEKLRRAEEDARLKAELLSRLTADEKRVLGIK